MRALPPPSSPPHRARSCRGRWCLACALLLLGSACLRSGYQTPPWLDATGGTAPADAGHTEAAVLDTPLADAVRVDVGRLDLGTVDTASADTAARDAAVDATGVEREADSGTDAAAEAGPAPDVAAGDVESSDGGPEDGGWTPARLAFAPGSPHDFGAVLVSATAVHSFDVVKTGDGDATAVSAVLAAPFGFAGGSYPGLGGTCGQTIVTGCTVVVAFAPTAPGAAQAALELAYDDGATAQRAQQDLSGRGQILALQYWEQQNVFGGGAYGQHRLLIGPGSSLDPEDGTWTLLADGAAMYNADAFVGWSPGYQADLTAWSGQSVRVAFHYYGSNRDKWYVDDVCVTPFEGVGSAVLCVLTQTFDSTSQLPADWHDVPGAANTDSATWRASVDQGHTAVSAAVADPSSHTTLKDRYLVSPPFGLP